MNDYSLLYKMLSKALSIKEKKDQGIFFTPPFCIENIIQQIRPYLTNINTILEPSCGSGEFITAIRRELPNASITGVELNTTIFNALTETFEDENTNLHNSDFLTFIPDSHYDLVIGNPPFNVLKKKDVKEEYHPYFTGRPNIFLLFIIKSINHLREGGILCFVLPNNFLNSLYYDNTREFISKTCDVIMIKKCDGGYLDTKQDTVFMVLRKGKSTMNKEHDKHVLSIAGLCTFTTGYAEDIKKLYTNSSTLSALGFKVSIGNVVWNQCKDILTDDPSATRLIYSSDFKNNKLEPKKYKNPDKKNFIKKDGNTKPVIMLNRGYGNGAYTFDYCILDTTSPYLLENHVICIEFLNDKNSSREELINIYKNLVKSFNDDRTKKFIELYVGNNAMSTTELSTVLPIYL